MMCIRCAVLCSTQILILSFRGCALMRETGLAMYMHEHRVQVHMGMENSVWVREHFLCRPAPSVRLPDCLPACLS